MIAATEQEYIEIPVALARDLPRLASLREGLVKLAQERDAAISELA